MEFLLDGGSRNKILINKKYCSPKNKNNNGTCLDDDMIIKLAKIINNLSVSNKKLSYIHIDKHDIKYIYNHICNNITKISNCRNETCFLTIDEIMDNLSVQDKESFKNTFKPLMPLSWKKNPNEWLSTSDIENSLKQHTLSDNEFFFYGAVPIDFHKCSVSKLCSIQLKNHIKSKQNKIGIVFNTDPHNKDGEHWISLYIDIKGYNLNHNPGIYYFDSYGDPPPKQIKNLIIKLIKQGKKINLDFYYFYNDKEYQKQNFQCGIYSINFIKSMITNMSFFDYLSSEINDKNMTRLRDEYFIKR